MKQTASTETTCRHHWLLGQPEGGVIAGVCRKCDQRRTFPAYLEEEPVGTAVGGARPSRLSLLTDLDT